VSQRYSGPAVRQIYVSVGSNVDPENNIRSCVRALREAFGELTVSPVYKTPSYGFEGDDFLNLAVRFTSTEDPKEVQAALRSIEQQHGRQRHDERFARDEITKHAFILAPLADIAAEVVYPGLGVPIGQLWRQYRQKNPGGVAAIKKIPFLFAAPNA